MRRTVSLVTSPVWLRIVAVLTTIATLALTGGLIAEAVNRINAPPPALSQLLDVALEGISLLPGDLLAYNSTLMKWTRHTTNTSSDPLRMDDLVDVQAATPAPDSVVAYDAMSMTWISQKIFAENVDSMQVQLRVSGVCPAQQQIRSIRKNGTVVCDASVANNAVGSSQIIDSSVTSVDIDSDTVQERVSGTCPAGFQIRQILMSGAVTCDGTVAPNQVGSMQLLDGVVNALKVDPTEVQLRVTGTCPAGSQARVIAQNGAVTCDSTVAPNQVGAAQIIAGSVGATKVDPAEVQLRVAGTCPAGSQISTINANGTVVCDNTIIIPPNTITLGMMQTGSVDSSKIVDGTIEEVDMSSDYQLGVPNGVCTLDGSGFVTASQLPPMSVTSVTLCPNITCRNATSPLQEGDVVIVMDRGDGNPETYIWDGMGWLEFLSTGVIITTTDDVPEGSMNLYFTQARVSMNADVVAALAHSMVVTGNPHQLSLDDLTDVTAGSPMNSQVLAWDSMTSMWMATSISGEANTASNVGTGSGLFKQKSGVDLEFYSLSAASSKVLIAGPTADTITLDVDASVIVTEGLSVNQRVDHSSVILSGANGIAVSGSGDLTASRTITFAASLSQISDVDSMLMPSDGDILVYNSSTGLFQSGQRRSGLDVGMGAGNVFKQELNNVLEFRSLVDAGSGRLSISTGTDTVSLDVQEGSVNHDALLNYVGSEHVDHSGVILSGANGITVSGSGDLTASRVISRDVTAIQSRVTGSCTVGQMITVVNQDGTVVCHSIVGGDGIAVTPSGTQVEIAVDSHSAAGLGEISFFNMATPHTIPIVAVSDGTNNFVEVMPITTLSLSGIKAMDMAGNGRLRYTGVDTAYCHVACTIAIRSVTGGSRIFVLALGSNSTVNLPSRTAHRLSINNDVANVAIHGYITVSTGDYINMWVANIENADNFYINSMNMFAMCMHI